MGQLTLKITIMPVSLTEYTFHIMRIRYLVCKVVDLFYCLIYLLTCKGVAWGEVGMLVFSFQLKPVAVALGVPPPGTS